MTENFCTVSFRNIQIQQDKVGTKHTPAIYVIQKLDGLLAVLDDMQDGVHGGGRDSLADQEQIRLTVLYNEDLVRPFRGRVRLGA
jgi:hypothetical protein